MYEIWNVGHTLYTAYLLYLGMILTLGNLMKRGLPLVNWCCIHQRNRETVDHLLLHFDVAYALWGDVLKMFGMHWVMPDLWLVYCFVGEIGLGNMAGIFGTWCRVVWWGLFGRSGIVIHLKIPKILCIN